jgi:integrase
VGPKKDRVEATFLCRAVVVFLGLFTGFRNEEAGGLRWGNVDLVGRKIYMRDVMREGVGHVREDSKTGKHGLRGFPLSPILVAVLLVYRQRMETILKRKLVDDDLVLMTGYKKPRPVTTQGICGHWLFIARKAGFTDVNGKHEYTYYDTRHTFANLHEKIGVQLFRVSKMLGHRTSRTTEESYLHDTRETDEYDIIVAQVNAFIAAHPVLAGRTAADLIEALGQVLSQRWEAEGINVGCAPLSAETPQIGYNGQSYCFSVIRKAQK